MPPPRLRPQERGFVLPLAMGTSLVLLLGSLSVHTASLQARLQGARERQLRQAEDQLVSAAQQVVADLNRQHGCLLSLGVERWGDQGAGCATPDDLDSLRRGAVLGVGYRLIEWRPDGNPASASAELVLELAAGDTHPSRRAAFAVTLSPMAAAAGQPSRFLATDLRLLGLRGMEP